MAQFKDFSDDRDFCQKLLSEQSVFCLPAQVHLVLRSLPCHFSFVPSYVLLVDCSSTLFVDSRVDLRVPKLLTYCHHRSSGKTRTAGCRH